MCLCARVNWIRVEGKPQRINRVTKHIVTQILKRLRTAAAAAEIAEVAWKLAEDVLVAVSRFICFTLFSLLVIYHAKWRDNYFSFFSLFFPFIIQTVCLPVSFQATFLTHSLFVSDACHRHIVSCLSTELQASFCLPCLPAFLFSHQFSPFGYFTLLFLSILATAKRGTVTRAKLVRMLPKEK